MAKARPIRFDEKFNTRTMFKGRLGELERTARTKRKRIIFEDGPADVTTMTPIFVDEDGRVYRQEDGRLIAQCEQ